MKLCYDRKSKNPTYFIQQGFRNGDKTTTRNIERIGRHLDLLAITPDPLAYAKERVEEFNREHEEGKIGISLQIDFEEKLTHTGDAASGSVLSNVGYFILQRIYHDLRIRDFLVGAQVGSKATYDFDAVNRFLTYARVLDPRSKLGTFDRLGTYYEKPPIAYQHILRFMDVLEDNYDGYLEHLFLNSEKVVKRDTSVCYYDCTNYYFESDGEDEDYVDEVTGEVLRGLRLYGVSKDHQPKPIVQMGLFMDGGGIPITMCINPGSDHEQKSAITLERKVERMFKGRPFIYCADAGLDSYNIRKHNAMGGRAFIITQSVKKLSDVLQSAVFNDYDYRRLSDGSRITVERMKGFDRRLEENRHLYDDLAFKVLYADRAVDTGLFEEKTYKNGNTRMAKSKGMLKQRVIVTFSRKHMEYQRKVRNGQIERAKKILRSKKVEDIKKGPNDVMRLIKRTSVGQKGEMASDHYAIDQSVIDREEKYDGYYAVATNLDDGVKTILGINHNRYMIEDCFRILKTQFSARPAYHRNRPRIIAHFMVCYTALLIYRLLEKKLDLYGEHFTTDQIVETLRNMNVLNVQDLYYASAYKGSRLCTALNGLFGLGLDRKNYLPTTLNKTIKKILK